MIKFLINIEMPSAQDFINKLFPSWQAAVIQLVATLILFFFVGKFFFKPVREILLKRQQYIEKNISDAENQLQVANEKNKVADSNILESQTKAKEIVSLAKKEAEVIKEKTAEDLQKEIESKRVQFQKEIEQEKIKANEEIKQSIVEVALEASSKILEREVSKEDNIRLVNDFIKEVANDE